MENIDIDHNIDQLINQASGDAHRKIPPSLNCLSYLVNKKHFEENRKKGIKMFFKIIFYEGRESDEAVGFYKELSKEQFSKIMKNIS